MAKRKQNNFSIALDELINGTPSASETKTETPKVAPVKVEPVKAEAPKEESQIVKSEPVSIPETKVEEKVMNENTVLEEVNPAPSDEVVASMETIIQEGTIINGSITSKNALSIFGAVEGDVETVGKLNVAGDITGRVIAENIYMTDGVIEGDVTAKNSLDMDSASMILGNVEGEKVVLSGRVKGNVIVSSRLDLTNDAVIFGDITAESLQMEDGATVSGNVTITSQKKNVDDSMFQRRKRR